MYSNEISISQLSKDNDNIAPYYPLMILSSEKAWSVWKSSGQSYKLGAQELTESQKFLLSSNKTASNGYRGPR